MRRLNRRRGDSRGCPADVGGARLRTCVTVGWMRQYRGMPGRRGTRAGVKVDPHCGSSTHSGNLGATRWSRPSLSSGAGLDSRRSRAACNLCGHMRLPKSREPLAGADRTSGRRGHALNASYRTWLYPFCTEIVAPARRDWLSLVRNLQSCPGNSTTGRQICGRKFGTLCDVRGFGVALTDAEVQLETLNQGSICGPTC